MRKNVTKMVWIFSILSILFVSCKKDDSVSPVALKSTVELLQNKTWKLTAGTVSPSYYGTTNWYNDFLDDCNRDDLFRFNTPNVFIIDEGASKCIPSDPQTQEGTWTYTESSKVVHITLNTPSDDYNLRITQINENSFTATSTEIEYGATFTYTWNFTKQ